MLKGKKDYKLVKIQMENLFRGIKDANDEDLILFSDEDEILNVVSHFQLMLSEVRVEAAKTTSSKIFPIAFRLSQSIRKFGRFPPESI